MNPSAQDIVRHAARTLHRGARLDMTRLCGELGVSRATLFRRVGNREELMGAALSLMSERTLVEANLDWRREHGTGPRDAQGRLRCLGVMETYRREVAADAGLRKLMDNEPVVALRVLTDPVGQVQPVVVRAHAELFRADVEAAGLRPLVGVEDLSFAVVRLGESFLYADALAARTVDLDVATTLLDALVVGALGR
ncbi:QsdR family transcriptional regulator [Actinokineospora bangkokensis]|uniref:Transcriptional regulator n=1 Tax=Actinokineospora bangkokensis TaxID=1193682 RepID=A0A1Q9LLR8_9PSEU|nr:QsdR family transcriptional regulator [Actinokineospora bangkokensis]OLR92978.1 transcriptional regulator [Actinokineospora bangkokensis]